MLLELFSFGRTDSWQSIVQIITER